MGCEFAVQVMAIASVRVRMLVGTTKHRILAWNREERGFVFGIAPKDLETLLVALLVRPVKVLSQLCVAYEVDPSEEVYKLLGRQGNEIL